MKNYIIVGIFDVKILLLAKISAQSNESRKSSKDSNK